METINLGFDILSKPLQVEVIHEKGYILLVNEEYVLFGYGSTLEEAKKMFEEDLLQLRQDVIEGLHNKNNTTLKRLQELRKFFGIEEGE